MRDEVEKNRAKQKQETPRPPNSDNQPPPRVWLHRYDNGMTFVQGDICSQCIPYVPEARVDAVWEKAIAIVNGAWRTRWYNGATSDAEVSLVKEVIKALEAARESEKQQ